MEPTTYDRIQVARTRVRQAVVALERELDGDVGDGLRLAWCADECAKLTRELRRLLRERGESCAS